MQLGKIKLILVLVLTLTFIFTTAVYSVSEDGWKGYGLFNISGSTITLINEDVSVELQNDKLGYNGEVLIRNYSNKIAYASLGMPSQGIEKITFMEKNSTLKWKKRSYGSLQNEFNIDDRTPKEDFWYVINLTLNPGETKLLNVKLEAVQLQEDQSSYIFTYFNDRKLGFSNQAEKSSLYISMMDFQPYNILALQGIEPNQIGIKGDIVLKADNIDTVSIKYMNVTKAVMDRLQSSAMYMPRQIALAFNSKNYNKASSLSDEYIKNPNDSEISVELIQFIKAESLRRLQNNDKYLSIIEGIDYSKLYPLELKNKIIMDRMSIYLEQQNQEKLFNLYKELEEDTSESARILKNWVENSSVFGAVQINKDNLFNEIQQVEEKAEQPKFKIEQWYNLALAYKYAPAIIFGAGLLVGIILSRLRFKRKKKKSMYIYRM
ncbi:MAG: hypothetical protein A2Y23_14485 [Clostridiales bacterium GWB2_37_7]|nr:MAG: hypothetical protein A2Y23_14485 [Clostridiales bacterium GWB2_37_7]